MYRNVRIYVYLYLQCLSPVAARASVAEAPNSRATGKHSQKSVQQGPSIQFSKWVQGPQPLSVSTHRDVFMCAT